MTLPLELYSVKQIRTIEKLAINQYQIAEQDLMERAGHAAYDVMNQSFPGISSLYVVCGGGNNGGDGYVLARLAHLKGINVRVDYLGNLDNLSACARKAYDLAVKAGVAVAPYDDEGEFEADLIVDAIFGIGLSGKVRSKESELINNLNASGLPILAIDTPSGLDADRGVVLGHCIKATVTVTFIGIKQGMITADGMDCCGELVCDSLGLSNYLDEVAFSAMRLSKVHLPYFLPERVKNSHKGMFGHVVIIGGGYGMPGAAVMAAMAAYRVGAGLVTVATHPDNRHIVNQHLPELMCYGVSCAEDLVPIIKQATVCVLGPGLGSDSWAQELFQAAISYQLPMVIDASALELLSRYEQSDDNWILTPHPGEAAKLLKTDTMTIQSNRYESAIELQKNYGGTIVLKGAGSIIQAADTFPWVCPFGNPGMATGGMGDMLSGVIGGLAAQGLSLEHAAYCGVLMHSMAGDMAAQEGQRGMLATDLLPYLRRIANLEEEGVEFEWDDEC